MNYTRISELNDVSILLIRCIREWVKAVFYSQNPMPTLKFLLSIHKAEKTALQVDNFMASIILSSSKNLICEQNSVVFYLSLSLTFCPSCIIFK